MGEDFRAMDADLDQILELLTRIWIKMWSHWHQFGSNPEAIDADMYQNVEPIKTISSQFSTEISTWGDFFMGVKKLEWIFWTL